ncbi:MAG: ABC transporter substrate-binding protein [Oscillibacter sp.]|nr:ABC transporter substrate-binding protein [Oscillibacter sp.]
MKKFCSILLALALVLSLAACGGSGGSSDSGSSGNSGNSGTSAPADSGNGSASGGAAFKIGGTGPLTGGASIYGIAVRNGAQIAVDEINAMGGIQFELNYEDDTHDAEKAVNAYNALKSWGMQLSMSSVTSTPAEATSPMNFEDRIFGLTPSASSVATTQGKDNVFQMCFIDPAQGTMAAHSIANNNLGTKIAVIWKNDDVYSVGIYETFMEEVKNVGLEVVSDTNFNDATSTDFSVQIADAQSKGADLVFLPMYYQPASQILAQAASVGYAPKWFGVDGMDGILTIEGFDPAMAEGVMLQTPFNASSDDAATKAFVEEYQNRFGEVPNQFAANAYDCVYAYKQALENAGASPDMSAEELCTMMIEQFTTMTFDGITGHGATWSTGGAVSKEPTVVVIENGVYVGLN